MLRDSKTLLIPLLFAAILVVYLLIPSGDNYGGADEVYMADVAASGGGARQVRDRAKLNAFVAALERAVPAEEIYFSRSDVREGMDLDGQEFFIALYQRMENYGALPDDGYQFTDLKIFVRLSRDTVAVNDSEYPATAALLQAAEALAAP